MKHLKILFAVTPAVILCAVCITSFLTGCVSPYIGKTRQEIVDIIAQDYKASPKDIYIRVSPDSNWVFNHPEEILNDPRRGKTMRQLEQWGILPYKKFWYDGSFFTLLTFKNDIVIEAEEIYGGGYGFKPWGFVFLLIAPLFL